MANENKNGGPWGSGGGSGGSGGGGGGGGPWGQQPRGGGPRGNGPRGGGGQQPPPDLDDLIRQLQRGLGRILGSGGGRGGRSAGGAPIVLILALALVVWVVWPGSGWYQVGPTQLGVVLRFGAYDRTTPPGLHFKLPIPFEQVELPVVTTVNRETIGASVGGSSAADASESLMLTGDENIVDLTFTVNWRVNDVYAYLFNLERPRDVVRAVSESAMREVIGQTGLQPIISQEIASVRDRVRLRIQETLDAYGAGIYIEALAIDQPTLPQSEDAAERGDVRRDPRAAFLDVQNAEQEKQRLIQEARGHANSVIPIARGEAAAVVEAARAYRDATVAEAAGEADRFVLIYEQYRLAPEVTRRRMFLETMEEVLGRANKVILDEGAGGGVVPYLPLNELNTTRPPSGGTMTVTGQR